MKRELLIALAAAGCSLRDPHVTSSSCTSSRQCARSDVCFLGECRPPASGLSVIDAEVRPPGTSTLGVKQVAVDMHQSALNNFALDPLVTFSGTVAQQQDVGAPQTTPGALVTLTSHAPLIPDHVEQVAVSTDPSGIWKATLSQGAWDILVRPPGPLPPLRPGVLDTATATSPFDISLPRPGALLAFQGGLTTTPGSVPLPGASVIAVDPSGAPISAPAISQADGGYALSLPPGTGQLILQIGPPAPAAADAGASPAPTPPDPLPTYDPVVAAAILSLPLPPTSVVHGTVFDSAGTPVASAVVYARSTTPGWTLSRSAITAADGTYALTLREGSYLLEAAPPADATAPALSAELTVVVPAAGPVDVQCPAKLKRAGQVVLPDSRPAGANVQITATRLADRLVTNRSVFVTTELNGFYKIEADAGVWRFEVTPPADSGLPRKIVQIVLDPADPPESALPNIQIAPPLQAVGTVCAGPCQAGALGVSGATVSFYARDATGDGSIFLGSALTDTSGRYKVALPDVANPSAGP